MRFVARATSAAAVILLIPATALVALFLAGAMNDPPPGLEDPGALTRWGLPAFRAINDAAATITIGFLVVAATVLPQDPKSPGNLGPAGARAVQIAAIAGSVWTVAGTVMLTFSFADAAGTDPFGSGTTQDAVIYFIGNISLGQSMAASVLLAAAATTGSWLATRTTGVGVCSVFALAAVLPLTVTAHGASNHEAAVNLLALHLIGATVWVGGLAATYSLRGSLGDTLAVAVRRYSRLAGWCFTLVLISGVGGGLLRLGDVNALASPYGMLLMLKTAALVLLGGAGWLHRTCTIPVLERDPYRRSAFIRLAGIELVLMAATIGIAVALGRTSPFATNSVQSAAESILGYPAPPGLGPVQWLTQWNLEVVWVPVAILLAIGYRVATRRWNRNRAPWSSLRTLSWLAGCLALAWATSGAPATYGRLMPGMHVLEETMIGLAVPVLLALGAPHLLASATLPRRSDGSRGLREWGSIVIRSRVVRLGSRPLPALGLYVVFLLGYYFTPILQLSLGNNPFRLATMAVALLVGLNFAMALLGMRAKPISKQSTTAAWILAGAATVHAIAGLALMAGAMQAGDWYVNIQSLANFPQSTQQAVAGSILWGGGLAVLLVLAFAVLRPSSTSPPSPHPTLGEADKTGILKSIVDTRP